MTDKIKIQLGPVQQTLLLPLWGRAAETRKKNAIFRDDKAVEIIDRIDYDFSEIASHINPITRLSWIGRTMVTDRLVAGFLKNHPRATIVDIGCGMDTNYERVDNGTLRWYDLDMPDVIGLRKNLISESERRTFISGSMLDYRWLENLNAEDGIFFIAAGVFYYFEEEQVSNLLVKLADVFPGCEILFDVASPMGVRVANKLVIKSSGMDEKSFLKWGLINRKEILAWDKRFTSIRRYSFFEKIRSKQGFKIWYGSHLSDWLNIMYMVHLIVK